VRNIWIITRHEYLKNIKRTGFLVFTFAVPVVLLGLALLSSSGTVDIGGVFERVFTPSDTIDQIAVVDQSGQFTPLLPNHTDTFQLYDTPEAGRDAVRSGEADTLLIIPQGYGPRRETVTVVGEEGASITEIAPESSVLQPFFVDHLLRERDIDTEQRALLADPYDLNRASLDDADDTGTGAAQQVADAMVPYFAGILLVMTIFLTSGYLLQGVANDKSSRIVEILLSSVSSRDLLAGKVLGLAALGLTQVVIWIGSVLAIGYGLSAQAGVAQFIVEAFFSRTDFLVFAGVYYLLGFLVYAALYGAAGAVGTSQQEAQQLAGFFSIIAAVPLFLAWVLFANPNGVLPRVLSYFPLTSPTMMLIRLPMTNVPTIDIVVSIGLLLVTIPVMIWIGARLFRLGLLMYSQRPTVDQMWRALRQS